MKIKEILCACLIVVAMPTYAQIQIEETGKTQKISEFEKEVSYISWYEDGYYFAVVDYTSAKYGVLGDNFTVLVYLGQNAKEIAESGRIIQQWFEGAKNDDFIKIKNKNGQRVCLYKYNTHLYCSYGSEFNCKATRIKYGADIAAVIAGGAPIKTREEREQMLANVEFGDYVLTAVCSFKKEFMKSINNFKEPGQVSQKVKQTVSAQIGETRKACKEKGLMETEAVQTYGNLIRELMKSEKESDWKTIERLNKVMMEFTKNRSKISLTEFEKELESRKTDMEKIDLFIDYSNRF